MAQQHCAAAGSGCADSKDCDCICGACNVAARRQLVAWIEAGWKERLDKQTKDFKDVVSQDIVPKGKGLI